MHSRYEINYLVYYNEIRIQVIDHKLKKSYIMQCSVSHYILDNISPKYNLESILKKFRITFIIKIKTIFFYIIFYQ
jgi:hypothetical protein